jgi:hypothetical protein
MHRLIALLLLPAALAAQAGDGWTVNAFRNPSVGLEYRHGALSVHSGYYTTILRDAGAARSEASGFARTGVTLWLGDRWYASLSHLRGLDGARDGRDFAIAEAGVQFTPWSDVHLRLGVAVIPAAHGFARKVNPTPGLSLGFTL